jgi:glycosyltransferase involved in cell wall biosynthesis
MNNPTVSLIVSTYNWDAALYLCLKSILTQKKLPNEIIIADDGSDFKTKTLIRSFQETFPVPLLHVWHEDNGFQLAKIRNRAIKKARFEYIIQIDGDLILNKHFISDHLKFAKTNHFTRGSRVRLGEKISKQLLESKTINFTFFNRDIDNRLNGFRNYFLAKLLAKPKLNPHKMLGCNMGYWKEDALKVNGYENLLVGWGHEDEEFAARLVNNNIFKIKLKHYSIVNHIYHKERVRNNEDEHYSFIKNVIEENKKVALNGINELD